MAKYLVLIYGDETQWADAPESWHEENAARHRGFAASAGGAVLDGGELEPASRSVSVRGDAGGHPVATDGPFVESKEGTGGYYLLEAADLTEAVRLAGLIPEATGTHGGVEVRRVV